MIFLLLIVYSVAAALGPSNVSKEIEEDAPVNRTEEDVHHSKVLPTPSMGVASDNAGSTHLVRVWKSEFLVELLDFVLVFLLMFVYILYDLDLFLF